MAGLVTERGRTAFSPPFFRVTDWGWYKGAVVFLAYLLFLHGRRAQFFLYFILGAAFSKSSIVEMGAPKLKLDKALEQSSALGWSLRLHGTSEFVTRLSTIRILYLHRTACTYKLYYRISSWTGHSIIW